MTRTASRRWDTGRLVGWALMLLGAAVSVGWTALHLMVQALCEEGCDSGWPLWSLLVPGLACLGLGVWLVRRGSR